MGTVAEPTMPAEPIADPPAAGLVDRVRALVPLIAEVAPEAETARRPLDHVIEALAATGVFRSFVPARWPPNHAPDSLHHPSKQSRRLRHPPRRPSRLAPDAIDGLTQLAPPTKIREAANSDALKGLNTVARGSNRGQASVDRRACAGAFRHAVGIAVRFQSGEEEGRGR